MTTFSKLEVDQGDIIVDRGAVYAETGGFKGDLVGGVTGDITGDVTGNADTATALETARTIAGQSFDGSANITIAATDLSDTDQSLATTDDVTFNSVTGDLTGDVTGLINGAGLHKISEVVPLASFTDNEDATGTYALQTDIPAGAYVLCCLVPALTGFSSASNTTTATVTIGDGTDVDRYHTGTPNVMDDAANGIAMGVVSGEPYHDTAKTPTIIITEDSDFTQFETGSITVEIFYLT